MRTYSDIFFTWCIPGLILVLFGRLAGHQALMHFGMSLLAVGFIYYAKIKRHHRAWSATWLVLALIYLVLGLVELVRFR
jgi:hypothetical protein